MTDWLALYKKKRTKEGCVIHARRLIVEQIMGEEGLNKEQAQDKLTQLINDQVKQENHKAERLIYGL